MRVRTKIEAIEKRLHVGRKGHPIILGRKQAWDALTPEERQRLPESTKEWVTVQELITRRQQQGSACGIIGYSPRAEIDRRKELGIW